MTARLAGAVVAALVALAAVAAVALAPRAVAVETGTTVFGGTARVTTLDGYGARGSHLLYYADGETLVLEVPVRNDGLLPMTVTSAEVVAEELALVDVRAVTGLPLRLAPGEHGTVTVQAELDNCRYYHEREIEIVDRLRLGVEVLGRASQRTAQLDRPLLVHSPMIVGCPERKLHRQAENRRDVARLDV